MALRWHLRASIGLDIAEKCYMGSAFCFHLFLLYFFGVRLFKQNKNKSCRALKSMQASFQYTCHGLEYPHTFRIAAETNLHHCILQPHWNH